MPEILASEGSMPHEQPETIASDPFRQNRPGVSYFISVPGQEYKLAHWVK